MCELISSKGNKKGRPCCGATCEWKILSACNRIVDKVGVNSVKHETYKYEQYTNDLAGSKVACIIGYGNFRIHEHMNNNDRLWGSRAYEHQVLTHVIVKSVPQ